MQLQKENIQAQLQVLKAQVHPHFLFNTLNNIFAHTQNTSPVASRLVMGLSDMLRYILYEGNQTLVPLSSEIKMLQDYMLLEKIRYGNKLDVHFDIPANMDDYVIAPLLLLPFVENSFKHGVSQVLDHPWLSLQLSLSGNTMQLKLMNGKPANYIPAANPGGLGIQNVRRRLDLLYAGKHVLKIKDEPEVFIVDLRIELEQNAMAAKPITAYIKTPVYE